MTQISDKLFKDGFLIINNCIDTKVINNIVKKVNVSLVNYIDHLKLKRKKNLTDNFNQLANKTSQFEIQKKLSKDLFDANLIDKIFDQKKLLNSLISLLGPDLSYMADFEVAISSKNNKMNDYYYVKKFHQEFWSGMGLESLQLWIPINLKKGMGTIEIIKNSHEWGHIPHQNREPLKLPKNYRTHTLNIKPGSVAIMSALTLHKTIKNSHNEIRIALPITVRNFHYPNYGNSDLFNFRKFNQSFFTKFRKKLGNSQLSAFRTKSIEEIKNFNEDKR